MPKIFRYVLSLQSQDQTNFYLINNELFDIDPKNVVMVGWN